MAVIPKTTLKVLTEDNLLYTMEEWLQRHPDAATEELRNFVEEFNRREAAEAPKRAEEAAKKEAMSRWSDQKIGTIEMYARCLYEKLYKTYMFLEAINDNRKETIEKHMVEGHNSLSKCLTDPDHPLTRERVCYFISNAESYLETL